MAFDYPKWAPTDLCEYHKDWLINASELKNDNFHLLEKLITDARMQPIWEKLEGLAVENIFEFYMLMQDTDGPHGADRLTNAELRKAVLDIEKQSCKLADLVKRVMPYASVNNAPPRLDNLVVDVIMNLGAQANRVMDKPRILRRPGSAFAGRNYFVRRLSAFFIETFGSPMHSATAELHSIFMPEEAVIGVGDVRSILRDSPL